MLIHRCVAVCGVAFISSILSARADWKVTTIDAGVSIGNAASLTLGATGVPHIAYFRPHAPPFEATFCDLYYATRAGTSWTTEPIVDSGIMNGTQGATTSIATTELGNPVVSFTRSSTAVRYGIRSAGTWTITDVSNTGGGYSSLVWQGTEMAATPKVAFNDSAANDLRVATQTAGTFSSQALDTDIAAGAYCSMAQVGSYVGIAYIDGSKLGFWQSLNDGMNWGAYSSNAFAPFTNTKALVCALALAPERNHMDPASTAISAHILYFDNTTSSYKYITNDTDTGTWAAPELVYQSSLVTITQSGCSIAVDSAGNLHAAFLDYGSKQLRYAKRTSSGWSTAQLVEGSSLGGAFCTVRVDAQNQPFIAYAGLVDVGAGTFDVSGLRFAEISSSNSGGGTLSFAITGKSKRTTSKSSLVVKGTASASAASIQWRVGTKGKFRSKAVAGGAWSIKVTKLVVGKNTVQFQAVGASGKTTSVQKLKITRE